MLLGLLLWLVGARLLLILFLLYLNFVKISLQALFRIFVLIDEFLGDVIFVSQFTDRMAARSTFRCPANFKVWVCARDWDDAVDRLARTRIQIVIMGFGHIVGSLLFSESKPISCVIMGILETPIHIKTTSMNTSLLGILTTLFRIFLATFILKILIIKFWPCFIEGSGWCGALRIYAGHCVIIDAVPIHGFI